MRPDRLTIAPTPSPRAQLTRTLARQPTRPEGYTYALAALFTDSPRVKLTDIGARRPVIAHGVHAGHIRLEDDDHLTLTRDGRALLPDQALPHLAPSGTQRQGSTWRHDPHYANRRHRLFHNRLSSWDRPRPTGQHVYALDSVTTGAHAAVTAVSGDGRWGLASYTNTPVETAQVTSLRALAMATDLAHPSVPTTFLVPHSDTVRTVHQWRNGSTYLPHPARVERLFATQETPLFPSRLDLQALRTALLDNSEWEVEYLPLEHGHPLSEVADSLALMATRAREGGDPLRHHATGEHLTTRARTFTEGLLSAHWDG